MIAIFAIIAILLILFVVYSAIVLFFTYFYITFPAVALIIIYKKRKSIWKSKNQNRTFYKAKSSSYASAGEEELLTGRKGAIIQGSSPNYSNVDISALESIGLSQDEAKLVFGKNWRRKIRGYIASTDETVETILKIQTKIMFDLKYRMRVIPILPKIISMIESVTCDNPEMVRKYEDNMGKLKETYKYQWKFFKIHQKTTFEVSGNQLDESEAYKILNLDPSATIKQVKARFRELALKHHPDKNQSGFKTQAEEAFVKIKHAYETILEKRIQVANTFT
jgi:hypothetical protein